MMEAHQAKLQHSTATVLVADDDEAVRSCMAEVLARAGYTVLAAQNGVQALRIAQLHHEPIKLLVTDVMMPEMNGLELAQEMQKLRPEIRTLYVSAHMGRIEVLATRSNRHCQALRKPFAVPEFIGKVQGLLSDA